MQERGAAARVLYLLKWRGSSTAISPAVNAAPLLPGSVMRLLTGAAVRPSPGSATQVLGQMMMLAGQAVVIRCSHVIYFF